MQRWPYPEVLEGYYACFNVGFESLSLRSTRMFPPVMRPHPILWLTLNALL